LIGLAFFCFLVAASFAVGVVNALKLTFGLMFLVMIAMGIFMTARDTRQRAGSVSSGRFR